MILRLISLEYENQWLFDVVDLLNSAHVLDQSVNDSGSAIMMKPLQPTAVPETMHVLVCPVVNQYIGRLLCPVRFRSLQGWHGH